MRRPPLIAVCGGAQPDAAAAAEAHEVGAEIARAGAIVICGGQGGVMAAAAEGARSAGGMSVGLLPGWEAEDGADALTVAIPTGLEEMRNALLIRAARGVIAVDGGVGTLTEIALALRLGRPCAALRSWELRPRSGAAPEARIHVAGSPAAAVRWVLAAIG